MLLGNTTRKFRAEKLLVATGRRPNTDNIAIENAGVLVSDHGQIRVDECLRTNVPHISTAGDVIGRETNSQMATPVGSQDGAITMVGNSAAEVIHEAAMALRFHATIDDFINLLHVYPTMAEVLKIVAISRYKNPAKLSCCAE